MRSRKTSGRPAMNSFALIAFVTVATDFSLAALSIARARILKTLRHSLTALAAFAIASSFVAASFAGEFTVHQGKRYRATLVARIGGAAGRQRADRAEIPRSRFRQRARFRVRREAQGRRCVARQGYERQPAPADRRGCQIVRARPAPPGAASAKLKDNSGRSGGRRSQRRRCRVRRHGRRRQCL